MVKYELRVEYDPKSREVKTDDVNGNWPEHHKALREQIEKSTERLAQESGLGKWVTTIKIS